jgi:hypothetical protein
MSMYHYRQQKSILIGIKNIISIIGSVVIKFIKNVLRFDNIRHKNNL